jgi:uncharacterized protein YigA (DUF484 family)
MGTTMNQQTLAVPYEDQRMVDAQARIISKLNSHIKQLQERTATLEKENNQAKANSQMYEAIIDMVIANPTLQVIWDELIMAMRLIDPSKFK